MKLEAVIQVLEFRRKIEASVGAVQFSVHGSWSLKLLEKKITSAILSHLEGTLGGRGWGVLNPPLGAPTILGKGVPGLGDPGPETSLDLSGVPVEDGGWNG